MSIEINRLLSIQQWVSIITTIFFKRYSADIIDLRSYIEKGAKSRERTQESTKIANELLNEILNKEYTVMDFVEKWSDKPVIIFDIEETLDSIVDIKLLIEEIDKLKFKYKADFLIATGIIKTSIGNKIIDNFINKRPILLTCFHQIIRGEDYPDIKKFYSALLKQNKISGKSVDEIIKNLERSFDDNDLSIHQYRNWKLPVFFGTDVLLINDAKNCRDAVKACQEVFPDYNYQAIQPTNSAKDLINKIKDWIKSFEKEKTAVG